MEICCEVITGIIMIYIIFIIINGIRNIGVEEEKRKDNLIRKSKEKVESNAKNIQSQLNQFFLSDKSDYLSMDKGYLQILSHRYVATSDSLDKIVQDLNSTIIYQSQIEMVSELKNIVNGFKIFGQKVSSLPDSIMIDKKNYGKVNKEYWDFIGQLNQNDVLQYIDNCEEVLNKDEFNKVYKIDIEIVLKCIWFLATEKTFSASDFNRAKEIFYRIYKNTHSDIIIADLYAKKKMGGEDVLRDFVRNLLKEECNKKYLATVASGLMWMNAYKTESTVLQHMLTSNMQMTPKMQERLHALSTGGGNAPSGHNVNSTEESLYFDVSAVAWKDEEYIGLFENLSFQETDLTYSLAVRDEDKDLFITQGISVPNNNVIHDKLKTVFLDEYGEAVQTKLVEGVALSGSGKEKMNGILISSNECAQMGIFVHVIRIGKKLDIKFYTLFMPTGSDLGLQKQQVLSMHQKLSPLVTNWESSLKETTLMVIQQLLNSSQKTEIVNDSDEENKSDELIF